MRFAFQLQLEMLLWTPENVVHPLSTEVTCDLGPIGTKSFLTEPGLIFEQLRTGFYVASVHSILLLSDIVWVIM